MIGFGRHLQMKHPAWANHDQHVRRSQRIVKTLQDVAFAKEQKRFERKGLRRIPISRFDEKTLVAISDFVRRVEADPTANLLLNSIRHADEAFKSKVSFQKSVRKFTTDVEAGIKSGTYVTTEKATFFDPRISLEILKLMWTLGRGWSMCVHILLLYGINAFVEQLARDGVALPVKVRPLPQPEISINRMARDVDTIIEDLDR